MLRTVRFERVGELFRVGETFRRVASQRFLKNLAQFRRYGSRRDQRRFREAAQGVGRGGGKKRFDGETAQLFDRVARTRSSDLLQQRGEVGDRASTLSIVAQTSIKGEG